MTVWRMSCRVGNQGYEMWPACFRLGVAAITYSPLAKTDLAKYPKGKPQKLWARLEPAQKASLRRVAYEIKAGDLIYAKRGPKIVGKGVVEGRYRFDSKFRIKDPNGVPWAHQVPVKWEPNFPEIRILLGSEQLTVKKLSTDKLKRLQMALRKLSRKTGKTEIGRATMSPRVEDAYYRESSEGLEIIVPRHNMLSNDFRKWLKKKYGVNAVQERQRVDIFFKLNKQTVLAELKVCYGVGTTKSIREALGQLFEYNHYPPRITNDVWLVVLDDEPSAKDLQFIELLRDNRSLPLAIGWRSENGFSFHPSWPQE